MAARELNGDHSERLARLVLALNPHDILLGRGAPLAYYEGNVRFREVVRTRKEEYMSTGRHQRKQEIARELYEEVGTRSGRFLAKMDPAEAVRLGVPVGTKAWYIVDEVVAMEKVKQALREKDSAEAAFTPTASVQPAAVSSSSPQLPPQINAGGAHRQNGPMEPVTSQNPIVLSQNRAQQQRASAQQQLASHASAGAPPAGPPHAAGIRSPSAQDLLLHQLGFAHPAHANPPAATLPTRSSVLSAALRQLQGNASGTAQAAAQHPLAAAQASLHNGSLSQLGANLSDPLNTSSLALARFLQNQDAASRVQQRQAALLNERQLLAQYRQQQEFNRQNEQLELQRLLLQQRQNPPSNIMSVLQAASLSNALGAAAAAPDPSLNPLLQAPTWNMPQVADPNGATLYERLVAQAQAEQLQNLLANANSTITLPAAPPPAAALDPALALLLRGSNNGANLLSVQNNSTAPTNGGAGLPNNPLTESTIVALLRHQAESEAGADGTSNAPASSYGAAASVQTTKPPSPTLDSGVATTANGTSPPSCEDDDRKPQARKRSPPKHSSPSSASSSSTDSSTKSSKHKKPRALSK